MAAQRTRRISFRVTEEELRAVRAAHRRGGKGQSFSEFCRTKFFSSLGRPKTRNPQRLWDSAFELLHALRCMTTQRIGES